MRWTGNFKCDLWASSGIPITLALVNGRASQSFSGAAGTGTVVTISLSGNQLSGTVVWQPRTQEKKLTGTFSATISGNTVTTSTVSRADFKNAQGPNESQCTLVLSRSG